MKAGTEKAAFSLSVSMNFHLALYHESEEYFENKDPHVKFCLRRHETYQSQSGRITVIVVKTYNTAYKINILSL